MSDNYTQPVDDDDEDFKNLRAKAKKADQYEREVMTLKRENAFIKAGVNMDDPKMGYFVKGYDGELTSEAIKEAAISAGFMAAPAAAAPDPAVQQAQAGQAAVVAASAGTQPEFDTDAVAYGMQQALAEGGMDGLAAYAQQYGITFNSPTV